MFMSFSYYQLREYIDDTEDYINIQVKGWTWTRRLKSQTSLWFYTYISVWNMHTKMPSFWRILYLQLDNHRNQLIQVLSLWPKKKFLLAGIQYPA